MADLVLAHSSDLHIGFPSRDEPLDALRRVLATAAEVRADILLLVGDVFDNNRVPDALVSTAARMLASSGVEVVVLPGNHDPLTADSVYNRTAFADLPRVRILGRGAPAGEQIAFAGLDLAVWGRAHWDYEDMQPLVDPPRRSRRWHVVLAHGHVVNVEAETEARSWLIRPAEIAATNADYVALGHWDRQREWTAVVVWPRTTRARRNTRAASTWCGWRRRAGCRSIGGGWRRAEARSLAADRAWFAAKQYTVI